LKNGPQLVITDLCVMDFEPSSKYMRLKSVHRGVSAGRVQEKTGFELLIPDKVPETEAPTVEQVKILREKVDPKSMRKLEFRGSETKV
jgi:glutaconate CoA-transferase subunit B